MKKIFIASAIAAVSVLSSAAALASDGTINFTGEVLDSACTVDIGANNTMEVTLGSVAKTAFTGKGSTASYSKFNLKLTKCPATVTSASVKFEGTSYAGDDSVLALTEEDGVATGVGVQISDASNKVVELGTATASTTLAAGDNVLPFYARYIQQAAAVTAGPANSVAQFTLNYN
ncbi:fimbrial protein [Lelliottia sp. JS-SCA-14]|uniref:fimbrial protein n=1 Tax=Lelliottia sp. JS-SCA-14 TaxID=3110110 RepID=UPI002D77B94B|nr:fimbrial protein [Lelliottia sp. JS-SCA-14]